MHVVTLIPLLDVEDESDNRPALHLHQNRPIVIGRSIFNSAIQPKHVSRELIEVEWKNGTLRIKALKDIHFVRVKNEPLIQEAVLMNDDIISLWNDKYSYKVRYHIHDKQDLPISSNARRKLTDHLTCPICLEILTDVVIIVPCGHKFCRKCCSRKDCATCRAPVQSILDDKYMNELIIDLVREKCLDPDDSDAYLQRVEGEVRNCL
jgi:RING-type zinc-finger